MAWPAPMALAFRQPSIDIFAVSYYLSNQFMVNKIVLVLVLRHVTDDLDPRVGCKSFSSIA